MIFNTIYQRELRVGSRSCRMPAVIALFDLAMAVMVLTSMTFTVESARETSIIDYDAFLNIFIVMGMAEFVFMMVMAPAFSSGAISGEAERKTLDMMLTTKLGAGDIVIGKLVWSLSSAMLMVASSLPILAILVVYGYVRVDRLIGFLFMTLVMELYVGSLSLWASAATAKTAVATAVSYGALLLLTCGTPLFCAAVANMTSQEAPEWVLYLNPLVPIAAFLGSVVRKAGPEGAVWALPGFSADTDMNTVAIRAVATQIILSVFFICMAVRCISPERRK